MEHGPRYRYALEKGMSAVDRGTGMRLRKVCPQCSTVINARRSICESCNISLSIIIMSCLVLNIPHYVL